jgi:hypothetical protein
MVSRLRTRLERRGAGQEAADGPSAGDRTGRTAVIDELRRRIERIAARAAPGPTAETRPPATAAAAAPEAEAEAERGGGLPGAIERTAFGPVHLRCAEYPPGYRHGSAPADAFLGAGPGLAALARLPDLAGIAARGALFVDTETTGLAGGTGTLPFLVGLGRFEGGAFAIEQILCRDPSEERAQLELLRQRLASAACLVSFNGRAFDLPLLNTRFVMHRLANPGYALPHLDLLHVARRVFGRRLDDRSLGALEDAVLGFRREGDIPGHAIPAAYADFLRGGPTGPMRAILEHNAMDLVALAALGGVLALMYADPESVEHAADHLGLARSAFASGESDTGFRHLDGAAARGLGADRAAALHMAAAEASRRREWEKARDLLREIVASEPDDALAHLALAKLHEHRFRDFASAARHAARAAAAEGAEATARRLARLERKGWQRE